jgi:hypothetical protein
VANEADATFEFIIKQETKVNGAQMPTLALSLKTQGMKQEVFLVKGAGLAPDNRQAFNLPNLDRGNLEFLMIAPKLTNAGFQGTSQLWYTFDPGDEQGNKALLLKNTHTFHSGSEQLLRDLMGQDVIDKIYLWADQDYTVTLVMGYSLS